MKEVVVLNTLDYMRRCNSLLIFVFCVIVALLNVPDVSQYLVHYDDEHSVNPSRSDGADQAMESAALLVSQTTTTTTRRPIPVRSPDSKARKEDGWVEKLRTPYWDAATVVTQRHNESSHQDPKFYFQQIGHSLARAFDDRRKEDICSFEPLKEKRKNNQNGFHFQGEQPKGLFLNKVPKTASTVLTTVNIRIARRLGARMHNATTSVASSKSNGKVCARYDTHCGGKAPSYFGNRHPTQSFLWGSLRDPASRAVSRIFFQYFSKKERIATEADEEEILRYLKEDDDPHFGSISAGQGGFQTQYLALDRMDKWSTWSKSYPTLVQRLDLLQERVQKILNDYDFLALTERLEESIVALQLMLGLPLGDFLYFSSKVSGESYFLRQNRPNDKGKCVAIQKAFKTPAIEKYLASAEWYASNFGDYTLYAAANKSLDMTIDRLGRDRFEEALRQFRHAQRLVAERCRNEVFPPCSAGGENQKGLAKKNCYQKDQGCGYPCIDKLCQEQGW